MDEDETLLATYHADKTLLRVLVLEASIFETKRNAMAVAQSSVRRCMEVALNAHRRGGVTSGQLKTMEGEVAKLEGIA